MLDMDDILNENIPMVHRAMMVDHYANDFIFGKLIGKLKEEFKGFTKSDLIYITYRKEMYNYHVMVSYFDEVRVKMTSIEYRIFDNANEMKEYIGSVQAHIDDKSCHIERRTSDIPEMFD